MFKKYYLKGCELLFLIFPISIVFSNFLANFTVYYIAIFGIYIFIKEKTYISKNIFYIVLIFWIYISARSLFTSEIIFSLKSSIPLIRYLFFIIAVSYLIKNVKNLIKNFSIIFFLFISLLFVDAIVQFLLKKNLLGHTETVQNRISSFFEGRFVLGSYLSKFFLLFLMILNINYPFKNTKTLYFFILILFFYVTLISGDRSALILLMLSSILFIALLDNFYLSFKEKIYILMIIIITLVSIFSFSQVFKNRFIFQTLNDLNFKKNILVNFPSEGHNSHWRTAFKMYLDNKVFGKGPNMFRHYCDEEQFNSGPKSCSTHPHNYHFQFLAELGLTGYISFLIFFLFTTFKLIKQFYCVYFKNIIYLSLDSLIMFIFIFSIFWPIITTGNVFGSFSLNIIIFVISIMLGIRHKKFINDRLR